MGGSEGHTPGDTHIPSPSAWVQVQLPASAHPGRQQMMIQLAEFLSPTGDTWVEFWGCWLLSSPALPVVIIWEVTQQMEALSLCLCAFQITKQGINKFPIF